MKATYLRILTSGPAGKDDYVAAAQLISEGYAAGHSIPDRTRAGYGGISALIWQGTTLSGNLFADELSKQLAEASFRSRIKSIAKVVIAWLAGIATALAPDILKMLTGG